MKTRSGNLAEDTALSFAKQMDDYIINSAVFKEAISKAFNAAVNDIIKPINEEIASLQCQVKMLKSKLAEASTKANDNEQYSRRNNIIANNGLSWNSHIDMITAKANRMLGLIKRTCMDLKDECTKDFVLLPCEIESGVLLSRLVSVHQEKRKQTRENSA